MNEKLKSPYQLVADALEANVSSVNDESAINIHPKWDSFNHLNVILAIEENYHITVPNNEMMKYDNIAAIITLHKKKTGKEEGNFLSKGFKKFMKFFQ